MTNEQLAIKIKEYLSVSYPNMKVTVEAWEDDKSRIAVTFIEEKFKLLYPEQRYHYIIHEIPDDFFKKCLSNTVWFELAPGEDSKKLRYLDNEFIKNTSPFIIEALDKIEFYKKLDNKMSPIIPFKKAKKCQGDFSITQNILQNNTFDEEEIFDICHVLMDKGGYCDCEVLLNVAEKSRYRKKEMRKKLKELERQK